MDKRERRGGSRSKTYKIHLARLLTGWREGKSRDFSPSLFLGGGKRAGGVGDPLETVEI